jgi:hypothetical protein
MIILVQYHPLFCWPGQKGSYTLPYFFCHQPLAMHAGSLSEEHGWKLEIKSKLGPPGEEVKPFLLGRCLVSAGPWLVLLPTSSAFPRATTCQRTVARESRRRCEAEMKQEHATSRTAESMNYRQPAGHGCQSLARLPTQQSAMRFFNGV